MSKARRSLAERRAQATRLAQTSFRLITPDAQAQHDDRDARTSPLLQRSRRHIGCGPGGIADDPYGART